MGNTTRWQPRFVIYDRILRLLARLMRCVSMPQRTGPLSRRWPLKGSTGFENEGILVVHRGLTVGLLIVLSAAAWANDNVLMIQGTYMSLGRGLSSDEVAGESVTARVSYSNFGVTATGFWGVDFGFLGTSWRLSVVGQFELPRSGADTASVASGRHGVIAGGAAPVASEPVAWAWLEGAAWLPTCRRGSPWLPTTPQDPRSDPA